MLRMLDLTGGPVLGPCELRSRPLEDGGYLPDSRCLLLATLVTPHVRNSTKEKVRLQSKTVFFNACKRDYCIQGGRVFAWLLGCWASRVEPVPHSADIVEPN